MSLDERLRATRRSLAGDFVPAVVAREFVDRMLEEAPEELHAWLYERANEFVRAELASMLASERRRALNELPRRRFRTALDAAAAGDTGPISVFATVHAVDLENTRRRVGEMRGPDHLFVANRYRALGERNLLLAECHRVIARRVGQRRTDEVLSEQQYRAVFHRLAGQAAA